MARISKNNREQYALTECVIATYNLKRDGGKDYQIIGTIQEMKDVKDVLGNKGMYLDLYPADEEAGLEAINYFMA